MARNISSRLVSSEPLVIDYVSRRTSAELAIETEASWRTWNILRLAFSNEVITPGRTRLMEVWGWIVDEWKSQHLDFNFPPGLTVYRRGEPEGIDDSANPLIEPGDLLHVDFGVWLMGLVTDQQHLAYVLRLGETEPPPGLQEAFRQSVRVAEIYAEELKPGRAGHEVKEIAENLAHQESIDALLYGHTQGNWVHGVGARTVFDWPERYGIFPRELVRVGEFWSIEFRVIASVPEWDGQAVPIPREERRLDRCRRHGPLPDGPSDKALDHSQRWLRRRDDVTLLVDCGTMQTLHKQARLVNTSVLMDASSQHLELALII